MKILVCGKGGSGKSTISILLAKSLQKCGFNILLVDTDESNYGLHRLLGVLPSKNLMDNLGGKKKFKKKINPTYPLLSEESLFPDKMKISDIPKESLVQSEGLDLLVIGKIHNFGEGCACPMGVLSKMILSKMVLDDGQIIIVDTEAGIEHFGRKVDAECDLILGIVDPTFESFLLNKKIKDMAEKACIQYRSILNKVTYDIESIMLKNVDLDKIIGKIPYNNTLFMETLKGEKLKISSPEMDKISGLITDIIKRDSIQDQL